MFVPHCFVGDELAALLGVGDRPFKVIVDATAFPSDSVRVANPEGDQIVKVAIVFLLYELKNVRLDPLHPCGTTKNHGNRR